MSFTYERYGMEITVKGILPECAESVTLKIKSDRNLRISRISDISKDDPDRTPGVDRYPEDVDMWFPVVDIAIEPSMYAQARINRYNRKVVYFNSYMNSKLFPVENEIVTINAQYLCNWENGLFMHSKQASAEEFAIYKDIPVLPTISHTVIINFSTLVDDWGGILVVYYSTSDGVRHIASELVVPRKVNRKDELSKGVSDIVESINLSLEYVMKSVNYSTNSPHKGGLYLFYDLEADSYRNGQWPWSWGIAIKFLLEVAKNSPGLLRFSREELVRKAIEIGKTTLKFTVHNPEHPAHNFGTTRYTARTFEKTGYQELINTGSDSGFLAGWGWLPLYETTGDKAFLNAATNYVDALIPILDKFTIPPQEWLSSKNTWTNFTIDESGFGTEGLSEIYRITGNGKYRDLCEKYMDRHIAFFERQDGLWDRQYNFNTNEVDKTGFMTRGMGWAMEGLLAAHRCMQGSDKYLKKAIKMADVVIEHQIPDGSWNFKFDQGLEKSGSADKGTALWCLLLYMLFKETHEPSYLAAARAALKWCMNNQYKGANSHALGGIVSCSGESGITYRNWFKMCCMYTSAFFGLAAIEEMKISGLLK